MKQQVKIVIIFLLLTFSFLSKIFAQLCQGSLGDPVVNLTFGSGSDPGAALNSLTNYTYLAADCPADGSYTIANKTINCFRFTWHSVFEDHTPGDISGYMMVVNASFNPGDFFVKTVDGLCPNTTYEFSAWILNILKPSSCGSAGIKPNITFTIETTAGTVLKSYKTGDIPAGNFPEWKQYGFFFSTTTGISSIVLRMTNNAPGGCGNDLLLDDITFRACGPLVTSDISGSPDSVDVCAGDNSIFTLRANLSAGYNDPVFQWQLSTNNGVSWMDIAGATNTTYVRLPVTTSGIYLYRFSVSERSNMNISSCSIVSNIVAISVNKFPVVAASNRGSCTGDTIFFNANDGILFSWTGPMNFTSSGQSPFIPGAMPGNSGTYYVKVTSDKGCISRDSTTVSLSIKPVVNAGSDTEICEGMGIQLNSTGINITSYQWSPAFEISNANIPNPIALPKQTTLYIITVANNKCKSSDSVMIVVNKNPKADAGPDKVIIDGQSVVLNGAAGGTDITYTWTPPQYVTAPGTLTPSVMPPVNETYTLHVISKKGCGTATDNVFVKIYKKLFIPNAFTPNNDGINDTWHIETLYAYPNADVKVFNRYGQIVFYNHGTNKSWDGRFKGGLLTSGAYAYIIDLKNNSAVIRGVVFIIL
ncbi:MAG: gliding motility-associated C-terminal domain-containing protein [Chitinophagaceae bacterium]